MIKRRSSASVDWVLLSIYFSIVIIGWLVLFSSSIEGDSLSFSFSSTVGRQTIWIGISFLFFIALMNVDWRIWNNLSYLLYVLGIVSLLAVLFLGREVKGATSWFSVFGFSLQPSEFVKIPTALAVASFISKPGMKLRHPKNAFSAILIFLIPSLLILLQPDAGTSLIFASFFVPLYRAGMDSTIYLLGGTLAFLLIGSLLWTPYIMLLIVLLGSYAFIAFSFPKRILSYSILSLLALFAVSTYNYLSYSTILIVVLIVGVYYFFIAFRKAMFREIIIGLTAIIFSRVVSFTTEWAFNNLLKPHQQSRVNVWLKPSLSDPKGELYNIIQSKTAIGSGGFWGKGFTEGMMTRLNYVPEQNTDFVFSILGEEQGFIGTFSLVALFIAMLVRITIIAERAAFPFIRNYAYGIAGIIFLHFFINVGMTMGLMPVIGIPLPFISKGGSSMLAFTIMIAILLKMDLARMRS
jgi:rod shape determining protein RodA